MKSMTTAPPRTWFVFSLRTLFIAVTVAAVGIWWVWTRYQNERVVVAFISGDRQTHQLVERELNSGGIEYSAEGSVVYVVDARRRDVPGAQEILLGIQRIRPSAIIWVLGQPIPPNWAVPPTPPTPAKRLAGS
jgi:hypothetical protein